MFWILYRVPGAKITEKFETDDLQDATITLQWVAVNPHTELIDFAYELDGSLDVVLSGVRLFGEPEPETAKAA